MFCERSRGVDVGDEGMLSLTFGVVRFLLRYICLSIVVVGF